MDRQLERAPVGYLILDKDWRIVDSNRMMLDITGRTEMAGHMRELLTVPGWMFFQTYFIPAIELHGRVREMEISMKGPDGRFPALLSAAKTDGFYECAIMAMPVRGAYESGLIEAKREAEQIRREAEEANRQLMGLVDEIEQKQAELIGLNERFREMASTDPLTGLPNRRAFEEKLGSLLERMEKGGPSVAFLMLDIDRFKSVNDTYGHDTGDEVLKTVAHVLGRESDGFLASRIGGEEFGVLLDGAVAIEERAAEFAEEIRRAVEESESPVRVTVSVGVAAARIGESASDVYKRADDALYRSKREGRNLVSVG
ncbi:sensor domain-containing diguanylate cyclase [Bhargavaea cecembensis]|uniref:sensor domain-containing diguanylate cyclase n=1 Tax=Bhargavaea cecembensis TaxID=394098 RepID=UPI0008410BED|nr:sensor domain-containing diguanylate cyclase [Bhargavaea cecembensis]